MTDAVLEQRVLAAARATGVSFETVPCDPELADTAAFCEHYGYAPEISANAIVVASKKPEGLKAACVVLATTRLDVNKAVRKKLGARRCSFATAEQTIAWTDGMQIGGVTVFGLPDDLPIWVDSRVAQLDRVIVGGGSRSLKLLVPPAAILALPSAELVDGLARL